MESGLSWGLTICTYNRPHFLIETLKYALDQTRMPNEIVIVDGSEYWEDTFKTVLETYPEHWGAVNLVYKPATVRSLPHQRN